MKLKTLTTTAALVLGLTTATVTQAHRAWMLPSATVLSGENAWVTVDGAVSNSLFYFEHHPLNLDQLEIRGPRGSQVEPQNKASGKYRSIFDAELALDGTYTFEIYNQGLFGSYTLDDKRYRWRGTAEELSDIPDDAEDVRLSEVDRRMQFFVTKGAPTSDSFQATGQGLELVPVTHPNDLFVGETAEFRFYLDGQPVEGLEVLLIRDGIRYRDQVEELLLTTDADGQVGIDWQKPGMYWLEVEAERPSHQLEGATRRLGYSATLEVLPL